jgi:cell volume regulation protein A
MSEISDFGLIVLGVSATVFVALLGMRLADRFSLPYAAVILLAAVVASEVFTALQDVVTIQQVERLTVVALVVILFDGGLHIGLRRFRRSAGPIVALGVLGTFATAGIVALAAHYLLGFDWIFAGLIGAAVAPTDPAVTFSVFGSREVRGRAGTILEGEAGMNDPVGIALMIGMIELATSDDGSFWSVVSEFTVEMAAGTAVGVAGAAAIVALTPRLRLPSPALYPLQMLASAGVVYGAATLVHGSGFLAVFVAGILVGDRTLPHRAEIDGVLSSLGSLAEITMFVALGLTVDLTHVFESDAWYQGLVLAGLLAFVIRPLVVGTLLLPVRLERRERLFVMWSGLKGAVPILLAALALIANVDDGNAIYEIVFVVVLFSVLVQGTFVSTVASRLGIPLERPQS